MTNEYETALVPELIKDAVRNALTGNQPAKERLILIQKYINQALTTVDNNDKLGLYRQKVKRVPRPAPSGFLDRTQFKTKKQS